MSLIGEKIAGLFGDNGLVGGPHLIRLGVARDPKQAIPPQGSYRGAASDFIEMDVEVKVTAVS